MVTGKEQESLSEEGQPPAPPSLSHGRGEGGEREGTRRGVVGAELGRGGGMVIGEVGLGGGAGTSIASWDRDLL